MKQARRRPNKKDNPKNVKFSIMTIILIIVVALASGITVHLLDTIHYNNLLTQANNSINNYQTEISHQKYDLKYLISLSGQILSPSLD